MGWLDRLREGLEEALAAEQAAALREEAGTRPRPPEPGAETPPPDDDPWPPPKAAPDPAPRPSPAEPVAAVAERAPEPVGEAERRRSLLARLRDPGAFRDAFVMKEILDRPLGLRRGRDRLRP